MTVRERVQKTLNFEKCDRLPVVEWARWWNQTWDRWRRDGIPDLTWEQSQDYFGLDKMPHIQATCHSPDVRPKYHGGPLISGDVKYDDIQPLLMSDARINEVVENARRLKAEHDRGDIAIRLHIDGFFSLPRRFFGIEAHLLAFYDQPDLMHRMNRDLVAFNTRLLCAVFEVLVPDLVDFAEDMSYNHGPMLSREMFNEFCLPYYKQIVPVAKSKGSALMIDSDGDITKMIPWFYEAGIKGVLPLERQAGVDIVKIRQLYPDFIMLGGFDKMTMPFGEEAMRPEFERILPVMRSGGFLPSVDHQTPPGVSLENYKIYVRLLKEYACKAV